MKSFAVCLAVAAALAAGAGQVWSQETAGPEISGERLTIEKAGENARGSCRTGFVMADEPWRMMWIA